ncbi:hypothetical protein D3C86_1851090 [compost metagenome]
MDHTQTRQPGRNVRVAFIDAQYTVTDHLDFLVAALKGCRDQPIGSGRVIADNAMHIFQLLWMTG